jgi:hypothetical protein
MIEPAIGGGGNSSVIYISLELIATPYSDAKPEKTDKFVAPPSSLVGYLKPLFPPLASEFSP